MTCKDHSYFPGIKTDLKKLQEVRFNIAYVINAKKMNYDQFVANSEDEESLEYIESQIDDLTDALDHIEDTIESLECVIAF